MAGGLEFLANRFQRPLVESVVEPETSPLTEPVEFLSEGANFALQFGPYKEPDHSRFAKAKWIRTEESATAFGKVDVPLEVLIVVVAHHSALSGEFLRTRT